MLPVASPGVLIALAAICLARVPGLPGWVAAVGGGASSPAMFQAQSDPTQPQVGPGIQNTGSSAARSQASSNKPGSVLFFPKFTSDARRPSQVNTVMSLTNTNSKDSIVVRVFYGYDCIIDSRFLTLAPNQAVSLLASREVPGETGYMIAVAVNSRGVPTQFNWLIGKAHILDERGHETAYNAFSAAKRSAGPVFVQRQTATAGMLFNGVEYDRLPKVVAVDSLQNQDGVTGPAVRTDLSLVSPAADLGVSAGNSFGVEATLFDSGGVGWTQKLEVDCALYAAPSSIWTSPQFNAIVSGKRLGWASFKGIGRDGEEVPVFGLSFTDGDKDPIHNSRVMQVLDWVLSYSISIPVVEPDNPVEDGVTTDLPAASNGQQGAGESRAGSVLLFPRYVSGENGSTTVFVTNTHPSQKIRLHLFFSGLAGKAEVSEAIVPLEAMQTAAIDPGDYSSNQKGWLMVVAIDNRALPVQFNHLIGSAQVSEPGGMRTSFCPIAIGKNTTESVARNEDNQTADLLFNGEMYDRLPATTGLAFVPSQVDNTTTIGYSRLSGSMLDAPNTRGAASVMLFDGSSAGFSAAIPKTEARLATLRPSTIQPPISSTIQPGENGWLKITSFTPVIPWAFNQGTAPFALSGGAGWRGGVNGDGNFHILTLADAFTIRVPAINPNNNPPEAMAESIGLDVEARRATGTIVRLDGTGTSDPDPDDPLTFRWSDNNRVVSSARVADVNLGIGTHKVSLTVTDGSGASSSTEEQAVKVSDTTPPQISGLPSNVTVSTDSDAGAAVRFDMPVAWDMIDGEVGVSASRASGSIFPPGRTVVAFTARDRAGNESKASFEVNVLRGNPQAQTGGQAGSRAPRMANLNDQYVRRGEVRDIALKAEDPDGDPVRFDLSRKLPYASIINGSPGERTAVLRIAPKPGDPLALGNIRLLAIDSRGQTFTTLPFRIAVSDIPNDDSGSGRSFNKPPVVVVNPIPQSVQANARTGIEMIFDASASYDPEQDSISFTWFDGDAVIGRGAAISAQLAVGTHRIRVVAFDGADGIASSPESILEVLPRDLTVFTIAPNRLARKTSVTLTLTGTGFNPATEVRFGKDGTVILNYVSIEEDRIVINVEILATATPGFRDVFAVNPNGKSFRLRSGVYVSP